MVWPKKRRSIFDQFNEFFDALFSDFEDDFDRMREDPFRKPKRNVRGFSVKISQVPGQEPKYEVQKFGPEGTKKVEPSFEVIEESSGKKLSNVSQPKTDSETKKPVAFEKPKVLEGTDPKGKFIELDMPDISDPKQVKLNILKESIEVKAINHEKGKGYFWIVKIPTGAKKVTKSWGAGKFRLYFA